MFSERLEHGKCDFQHLANGQIHDFGVLSPQNRLIWVSKALPSCNVERVPLGGYGVGRVHLDELWIEKYETISFSHLGGVSIWYGPLPVQKSASESKSA